MHRFMTFVDGSNLVGVLRRMNVRVDDYEKFYRYIFERSVKVWTSCVASSDSVPSLLVRTLWYAVGTLDDWDLADPKAQANIRDAFEKDRDLRRKYMALAGQKLAGRPQDEVSREAWSICYQEIREWYEERQRLVDGFRRFYYSVRSGTDFIDIVECGHWRLDMLHKVTDEKGLDTRLAVDMVTHVDHYDVALLISGDADAIPSLDYIRGEGKQIGVVEFLAGYPPEKRGAHSSSRLKVAADFVVQIYQMDLERDHLTSAHREGVV